MSWMVRWVGMDTVASLRAANSGNATLLLILAGYVTILDHVSRH